MNNSINNMSKELESIGLIGKSESFLRMLEKIKQIAQTNITVLITGESGTGKEMIARAIHQLSMRKKNPLITVNCGAIPIGILESELFGHEKGAFTGAVEMRKGYFELADRGTLLLDEIGEMPLETQVKLLRILEEKEFIRVGGTKLLSVDTRILAATNKDLESAVKKELFRKDLFYRINAVSIFIPPLRERKSDIRLLAIHFAKEVCKDNMIQFPGFTEDAYEKLENYSWPGNIRELRNIIERIIILERGRLIDHSMLEAHIQEKTESDRHLPMIVHKSSEQAERELIYRVLLDIRMTVEDIKRFILNYTPPLIEGKTLTIKDQKPIKSEDTSKQNNGMDLTLRELEIMHIKKVLKYYKGNRRKVSEALGIGERTLYRKLKEYGFE
jgi:transcriptional regulator with PAS, ATPase and Fis domain